MALLQKNDLRGADSLFRDLLAHDTANAQALMGRGIVAHQTGEYADALTWFDRSIANSPTLAAAHVNRGNSLAAMQRFAAAVASFEVALDISPELPSALVNMATALNALGRLDDAVAALERAEIVQPNSVELLNNLGNLLKDQGRLPEAVARYRRALELNPMTPQAFSNCLAAMRLDLSLPATQILAKHREWSSWFEAVSNEAPLIANLPEPLRRLRIGYVSPDCHTALPAFLDGVIVAHDREQFDIYCYFNNPQDPARLAAMGLNNCPQKIRIMRGMSDKQVATKVHDDGIDILIDIAGHTGHNRLGVFARRPAPVQIAWLDYLCTTALAAMDYRITDAIADPAGNDAFHSEKLLRMPHAQWCWRPDADAPPVAPAPILKNGRITFGSFNNAQKLTDQTLTLWRRVIEAVPDSQFVFAGIPDGFARARVRDALACESSRLSFLPRVSIGEYRAAFANVDIALDPLPFSGATTTLDALWQGVPVLTLPGERSCSRSTASVLTALRMGEWIATDESDFVARATHFGSAAPVLAVKRSAMRERMRGSPILDQPAFTRDLEKLFRDAWQHWCEGRALENDDAMLMAARAALDAGDIEHAAMRVQSILKRRPQWDLAKQELARACMAWSRANPQVDAAWRAPLALTSARQKISAIICSNRPHYFAAIEHALNTQFARHEFELIGIHNATSLCEGYNRGAARASGELLIFCHDDIEFVHADFGERLLRHLAHYDVVGVAGSSKLVDADWGHAGVPHVHGQIVHKPPGQPDYLYFAAGLQAPIVENIHALDGVFIGMQRRVWETLKFDEATFDAFHVYDIDFTYRAHLAGFRIAVPMDLLLIHFSMGGYDLKWQRENLKFLQKFPALTNLPAMHRHSSLHVKLKTLEQIERLHTGLLHHRFGA